MSKQPIDYDALREHIFSEFYKLMPQEDEIDKDRVIGVISEMCEFVDVLSAVRAGTIGSVVALLARLEAQIPKMKGYTGGLIQQFNETASEYVYKCVLSLCDRNAIPFNPLTEHDVNWEAYEYAMALLRKEEEKCRAENDCSPEVSARHPGAVRPQPDSAPAPASDAAAAEGVSDERAR